MSEEKKNFIKKDEGNPELELLVGIVLLAAGLFMLSNSTHWMVYVEIWRF